MERARCSSRRSSSSDVNRQQKTEARRLRKRRAFAVSEDILSPAAAHLARGDDWAQAGPALDVSKLVRLDIKEATIDATGLHGEVIGLDGPFGNLVLMSRRRLLRNWDTSWVILARLRLAARTILFRW